jgi:hypothetical protein
MASRERLKRSASHRDARIVGALLAIVWICAGAAGIFVGVSAHRWLLLAVGLVALWYGVLWVYVARQGRRLTARGALTPWRLRR